jgi:hypothetical protein
MRGYLVVGSDSRYVAESNWNTLRVWRPEDPGTGYAVRCAVRGKEPGVYRASDSRLVITVGPRVDPKTEARRLRRLLDRPAFTYHGSGRPGVNGYEPAMRAAEHAARARKLGTSLLASALEEM